ncbi:hypothetical protein GARC_1730 [Paraglaciecola arctica BSs20135]|uniref:Uncharacterized protein n=1 Tax=Paraglaciecola arctica BSs20135 TaxID=493475 RepID=K6YKJ9_9ALTE|nr:hypothetical protein GARC_1730 [Paraglaciecola arctica BSs20135]
MIDAIGIYIYCNEGKIDIFSSNGADNIFFHGFSFYYAGLEVSIYQATQVFTKPQLQGRSAPPLLTY